MNILVIDDSMSACRTISRILMNDALTYCCIKPEDWLLHYNNDKPDIILLDIMMPEINGVEILKKIRELNKYIPVIMVSGITDRDKIIECLDYGASGYITKPISSEKILSSVKNADRINAVREIVNDTTNMLSELKRGLINAG